MAYATGGLAIVVLVLVIGGTMAQSSSSRLISAQRRLIEAQREQLAVKDRLIDALGNQVDAVTRLAEEREKTLALYRRMFPSADAMRVPPSH